MNPNSKAPKNQERAPSSTPQALNHEMTSYFAGIASHELGNLLGTILGELDFAQTSQEPAVQSRALNTAIEAADRARRLASNITYFASHQSLKTVDQNLSQLVLDSADFMQSELRQSRVSVQVLVDTNLSACVDAPATQQALHNILRRSASTMPQGGKIQLQLKRKNEFLEIKVVDTGVGLPQERIEKILGGTGSFAEEVELCVARLLIEKQDGSFTIESSPDGSRYTLRMRPARSEMPERGEQRRYRRVTAALPVDVRFEGYPPFQSEIQTLSIRGCFVATLEPDVKLPPLEATGKLKIFYYQDRVLEIARCRVANLQQGKSQGIGVEFLEVSEHASKMLQAIVQSHGFSP